MVISTFNNSEKEMKVPHRSHPTYGQSWMYASVNGVAAMLLYA